MTSGPEGGSGGFTDALFGPDGTGEPASVVEVPPPVYADPLADARSASTASMTSSLTAPDAINRVPGPPPLTNEAIVAADRQLARERAQQRAAAEAAERSSNAARRTQLDQLRQAAQRRAAENAATRAGQHSQVADAYRGRTSAQMRTSNAPAVQPHGVAQSGAAPGTMAGPLSRADRNQLLQRMATASGEERRLLMRQLVASRNRGRSAGKGSGKGWGCAIGFVILILLGTGAGKEIVQVIVDALNNGR